MSFWSVVAGPYGMRGRPLALALAAALFVIDQATKIMVLAIPRDTLPIRVAPVLDITLVWNRGISYGLFQQDGTGRWILVALTMVAAVALGIWMWRTPRQVTRLAVAAIVGGALGNLVDRVVYGAVVDFVHLHWGTWSWYVFNVADAAIVLGVLVLLVDSLFSPGAGGAKRG